MGRAKKDQPAEVMQPDLKKMKSIFLRDLKPSGEQAAKIRGDQSAAWKAIENDCNCNKRAAKSLLKMFGESEELREDFLRTFIPGLLELNLLPREDLADMMGPDVDLDSGVQRNRRPMGAEGMPALQ